MSGHPEVSPALLWIYCQLTPQQAAGQTACTDTSVIKLHLRAHFVWGVFVIPVDKLDTKTASHQARS